MTWRNTAFDRARFDVTVDPPWLLAPLFTRDFGGLWIDPDTPGRLEKDEGVPLAAFGGLPVYPENPPPGSSTWASDPTVHEEVGRHWVLWWDAACAYRPGTPPPVQADLASTCDELQKLWLDAEPEFDRWMRARPATPDIGRETEAAAIAAFPREFGRDPAPIDVRIFVIPIAAAYLRRLETGLLVSARLRKDANRYGPQLTAALADYF